MAEREQKSQTGHRSLPRRQQREAAGTLSLGLHGQSQPHQPTVFIALLFQFTDAAEQFARVLRERPAHPPQRLAGSLLLGRPQFTQVAAQLEGGMLHVEALGSEGIQPFLFGHEFLRGGRVDRAQRLQFTLIGRERRLPLPGRSGRERSVGHVLQASFTAGGGQTRLFQLACHPVLLGNKTAVLLRRGVPAGFGLHQFFRIQIAQGRLMPRDFGLCRTELGHELTPAHFEFTAPRAEVGLPGDGRSVHRPGGLKLTGGRQLQANGPLLRRAGVGRRPRGFQSKFDLGRIDLCRLGHRFQRRPGEAGDERGLLSGHRGGAGFQGGLFEPGLLFTSPGLLGGGAGHALADRRVFHVAAQLLKLPGQACLPGFERREFVLDFSEPALVAEHGGPAALHPAAGEGASRLQQFAFHRHQPGARGVPAGERGRRLKRRREQRVRQQVLTHDGRVGRAQVREVAEHPRLVQQRRVAPRPGPQQVERQERRAPAVPLEQVDDLAGVVGPLHHHLLQTATECGAHCRLVLGGHRQQVGHRTDDARMVASQGIARPLTVPGIAVEAGFEPFEFTAQRRRFGLHPLKL